MRIICVTKSSVIDSETGESFSLELLELTLHSKPGGVIVGRNLFPVLATLVPMVKMDYGWTASVKLQQKKKHKTNRIGGTIYFTKLSYRFPKERANGKRYRPGSIKWTVLNLELFTETSDDEILIAATSLIDIANKREIMVRDSPGSFGGAMLRASPNWKKGRAPAPWFISDNARRHLPGNYYALRNNRRLYPVDRAYYLDQKSSHHNIALSQVIPHPQFLRCRGFSRAVEDLKFPPWITDINLLSNQVGLMCAMVECDIIPPSQDHLYPDWCKIRGKNIAWIWTPELLLLDRKVRLRWISCAYTSFLDDPAISEYAEWALRVLQEKKHSAIKPALLAPYGLLGINSNRNIEKYTVTGRPRPTRAETVKMPLIGECYRSTIVSKRVSPIQNVVARGVIESWTRTRSILVARDLESQGIEVSQIYADGVIAVTDSLPFIPNGWRVAGELTDVWSPHPNTIIAKELVRTPGIPSGRRTARIEQTSSTLKS